MMQMLADLATKLKDLSCAHGHQCKIQYVQTSRKASRRFLCNDCLHQVDNNEQHSRIIDLKDYVRGLRELATNETVQKQTNHAFKTETETALGVTQMLNGDLVESLGGIKTMVQRHYTDLMSKVTRNATKCSKQVIPTIEKDLKRQLFELSSIEKNLNVMHEGGNPSDVCQILDQAITYASKKPVADNGLFHLLTGLNPLEAAQSTHLRLTEYSNRYLERKHRLIKSVRDTLETRFKKDERMLLEFVEQRKKILGSIEGYLQATKKEARPKTVDPQASQVSFAEERKAMQNAMNQFGINAPHLNGKYLGKRIPESDDYDPVTSFERKFGGDKLAFYEDQINKLQVEGAKPMKNRLSDALKTMKPTQQSRFYGSNSQNNSKINENRFRSKRNSSHKKPQVAIETETIADSNFEQVLQPVQDVLRPRNSNITAAIIDHPYAKNTVQDETLKTMLSRKMAQSYKDYLASEKSKQANYLKEYCRQQKSFESKENQPISSHQDIHKKNEMLQTVMLEVPIKRLNANDPRRKTMAKSACVATQQTEDN